MIYQEAIDKLYAEQYGFEEDQLWDKAEAAKIGVQCIRWVLAKEIAEYMVTTGCEKTMSGNYHFEFNDINDKFGTSLPNDDSLMKCIEDAIYGNRDLADKILDLDTTWDFDFMFGLAYCPNAEEE